MRSARLFAAFLLAAGFCQPGLLKGSELKVIDKPLWIFPEQTFRIAIEQPKGSGKLDVEVPPTVKLYDSWPQDSIQRFYFRSLEPGDITLKFQGKAGTLEIPLEVIPWSDVYRPREFKKIPLPRIWPVGETDYQHIKKRRTFYSNEELQALRNSKAKAAGSAQQWI